MQSLSKSLNWKVGRRSSLFASVFCFPQFQRSGVLWGKYMIIRHRCGRLTQFTWKWFKCRTPTDNISGLINLAEVQCVKKEINKLEYSPSDLNTLYEGGWYYYLSFTNWEVETQMCESTWPSYAASCHSSIRPKIQI